MKPRIRKKGANKDGSAVYILEWIEGGKLCTYTLNARKILDSLKKIGAIKGGNKKIDAKKPCTNGTQSEQK